jgi:hypothetical protein
MFIVEGITDEINSCDCCGKSNLKKVVIITDTETGETKAFGTTCAQSPKKGFGINKDIKKAMSDYDFYIGRAHSYAKLEYKKLGGKWIMNSDGVSFYASNENLYNQCFEAMKIQLKHLIIKD